VSQWSLHSILGHPLRELLVPKFFNLEVFASIPAQLPPTVATPHFMRPYLSLTANFDRLAPPPARHYGVNRRGT
jgi:hypothetical protein